MGTLLDSNISSRVEICGGIATGKTSLVKALTNYDFFPILESFRDNPFWEAFCKEPDQYMFETEITFLLQHYHEILANNNKNISICDFSFILDLAYAELGMSLSQLNAFNSVYTEVTHLLPSPSLIVHLKCDIDEQKTRIMNRGRTEEMFEDAFLNSLNDKVEDMVYRFGNNKVLTVHSDVINYVNNVAEAKEIANNIHRMFLEQRDINTSK